MALGKLDRTVRLLEKADRLCPGERAETSALLVQSLIELGHPERASAAAQRMLGDASISGELRQRLERLQREAERSRRAPADPTAARAESETLLRKARELAKTGSADGYRQAIELCERARTAFPPNGEALLLAADLAGKRREPPAALQRLHDRARVDFERATGAAARPSYPVLRGFLEQVALDPSAEQPAQAQALLLATNPGFNAAVLDASDGRVVFEHDGWPIVPSADGRSLFVSEDPGVVEYDRASGRIRRRFSTPNAVASLAVTSTTLAITTVPVSPTGGVIGSEVLAWNLEDQTIVYRAPSWGTSLALSSDGQWLLYLAESGATPLAMQRLRTTQAPLRSKVPTDDPDAPIVAGAGRAAMPGAERVFVWELGNPGYRELRSAVEQSALAFGPADAHLDLVAAYHGTVERWDLERKRPKRSSRAEPGKPLGCSQAALASNANTPYGLCEDDRENLTRFWAAGSGVEIGGWGSPIAPEVSIARFDDASTRLAIGTTGRTVEAKEVRIWDLTRGVPARVIEVKAFAGVSALDFSPDGKALAVGSSEGIFVYDVESGKQRFAWENESWVSGALFDQTGERLAVIQPRNVQLFDARSGRLLDTLDLTHTSPDVMSGNRTWLAVGGGADVELWNVWNDTRIKLAGVSQIAVSPNGAQAAGIDGTKGVLLWDTTRGTPGAHRLAFETDPRGSIWFTADGKHLLLERDACRRPGETSPCELTGRLELRDLNGKLLRQSDLPDYWAPDGSVLALSLDGNWIVTGHEYAAMLWRAKDLSLVGSLWGVAGKPTAFARAPSGEVQVFGDAHHLACRIGPIHHPFALCQERYQVEGLFSMLLEGDASYREP